MINKELKQYIEKEILPIYTKLDEGHNDIHISNLLEFSYTLWNNYFKEEISYEMIYVAICYHDIGIIVDRDTHEQISFNIFNKDTNVIKFFSPREIREIGNAIKNHRASTGNPKTLLDKIVADSDHSEVGIERMIDRALKYTVKKFPGYNKEFIFNNIYEHLTKKYGHGGYSKLKLKQSDEILKSVRSNTLKVLNNKKLFRKEFDKLYIRMI